MLSTFTLILICLGLLLLKYVFLEPVEDRRLYRMYEARDNVALAAIEGKISQDADEYKFVIENINFEIYYMKNNYDFSIFFKNLIFKPEEVQKYFEKMYQLIEQYDILQESYNLSKAYFKKSLTIRLFCFIYFFVEPFYYILRLMIIVLTVIENISNWGESLIVSVDRRLTIMKNISSEFSEYKNGNLNRA